MALIDKHSQGCEIEGPTKNKWKKTILGFVDDTRQFNNIFTAYPTIIENLKHDAKLWQKLLSITGGIMRIDKYAFYYIAWRMNHKGLMEMYEKSLPELIIPQQTQNSSASTIKRLQINEPFKYVGITTTPDGNTTHSINQLKKYVMPIRITYNAQISHKNTIKLHCSQYSFQN